MAERTTVETTECEITGCDRPLPEIVVERRGSWRVVCPRCMDEMVAVWGWEYTGLARRSDRAIAPSPA